MGGEGKETYLGLATLMLPDIDNSAYESCLVVRYFLLKNEIVIFCLLFLLQYLNCSLSRCQATETTFYVCVVLFGFALPGNPLPKAEIGGFHG